MNNEELTAEEIEQIRVEAYQITQLAVTYAVPILIGRPPSTTESINNGSGVIVELDNSWFLFTAAHLLDDTTRLRDAAPDTGWHLAGHDGYAALDPRERVLLYDKQNDLLVLRLTAEEARAPEKAIVRPRDWPPSAPVVNEYVFICGYPGVERIRAAPRYWSFAPACIGGALDLAGQGRIGIRFERSRWKTYKEGIVPTLGPNLGGMSGGPIFSFRGLILTLIGVVSEHAPGFDILKGASLEGVNRDRLG